MVNIAKMVKLTLFSCLLIANAWAEDKNFGKTPPTTSEVIEHFKQQADTAPADTDDYQDVPESELENVRGLRKISSTDKTTGKKVELPTTLAEKAISMEILFDYNSATLTEQAKTQLEPIGRALASGDLYGLHYRIEGHTDIVGSDDFNHDLSRRRAEAVKKYLTEHYAIPSASIQIEGKGKHDLADAANPTSEANRRVRIVSLGK